MKKRNSTQHDETVVKDQLSAYFSNVEEIVQNRDGWIDIDIPKLSEERLLQVIQENGLQSDQQTKLFCQFLSLSTNFASMQFQNKLSHVPLMMNTVRDLIEEFKKEAKKFGDIAVELENLIQCFTRLVMETKHNLNLARVPLKRSQMHVQVLADALTTGSSLNEKDKADVTLAFDGLSSGIKKFLEYAQSSESESKELARRINSLKETVINTVTVSQSRLVFLNFVAVGCSGGTGIGVGSALASSVVMSSSLGGVGALVIGGVAFPPIGAILLGGAIGGMAVTALGCMIYKLWKRKEKYSLQLLIRILENLNKLQAANTMFLAYMNRSTESANAVLANVEDVKSSIVNESERYRQIIGNTVIKELIITTESMISTIDQINRFDVQQWSNQMSLQSTEKPMLEFSTHL